MPVQAVLINYQTRDKLKKSLLLCVCIYIYIYIYMAGLTSFLYVKGKDKAKTSNTMIILFLTENAH